MFCRISDAKPLGMSCWVPIFRAAGLLVLRTMEGMGEMDGDSEGEVEEREEAEEACLASCLSGVWLLSAGDGERGVGGSEDVSEDSEGMLEVELWEGVRVRRLGGDELDVDEREDSSQWLLLLLGVREDRTGDGLLKRTASGEDEFVPNDT